MPWATQHHDERASRKWTSRSRSLRVTVGRLDGAELAIRLPGRQSGAAVDLTGYLRSALTAILDTEWAGLGPIGPVCRALAAQVKARHEPVVSHDAHPNAASAPEAVI